SVVLGSTAPDAPGACPDCDCATAATGSAATRNGIMNFIGSPRSVWLGSRVDRSCGSFEMTARTGEASCRGFACCGAAPQNDKRSSRTPRWAGRSHKERLHLQLPKEVDHGGVDLRSAFLLGPMSAAWQHNRWPELWNECRLPGNGLLKHDDKHVAVAHN